MTASPLVLVAHGTRDEVGTALIGRLADAVARRLPGVAVRPAFVDVRRPTVADALRAVVDPSGPPAIVVPAFLGAGYHVREDLPRQVADIVAPGRAVLTPFLGSSSLMVAAAEDRLRHAGWLPGDAVLLAAAGSRDPRALVDVDAAAAALGARLGCDVTVGYLASGSPKVADVLESLRSGEPRSGEPRCGGPRSGGQRVAAASWLLAPGLFQSRLTESGADVVAGPLGIHPAVVRAVVSRYLEAVPRPAVEPSKAASGLDVLPYRR